MFLGGFLLPRAGLAKEINHLSMADVRKLSPKQAIGDLRINQSATILEDRTIHGKLTIEADNVVIRHNHFAPGSSIQVIAEHAQIMANRFESDPRVNGIDVRLTRARHAQVIGNYFSTYQASTFKIDSKIRDVGVYVGLWSSRKGRGKMLNYGAHNILVEGNLFENFLRKSAIRIKSIGNVIHDNRVHLDRPQIASLIASRHGSHNRLIGNDMRHSSGVQIFENDNELIDNRIEGRGRFLIMAGAGETTAFGIRQQHHASNTLLRGNQGHLIIGYQWQKLGIDPAIGTLVEAHEGGIERAFEEGSVIR